jgi:hypothetical protein
MRATYGKVLIASMHAQRVGVVMRLCGQAESGVDSQNNTQRKAEDTQPSPNISRLLHRRDAGLQLA